MNGPFYMLRLIAALHGLPGLPRIKPIRVPPDTIFLSKKERKGLNYEELQELKRYKVKLKELSLRGNYEK